MTLLATDTRVLARQVGTTDWNLSSPAVLMLDAGTLVAFTQPSASADEHQLLLLDASLVEVARVTAPAEVADSWRHAHRLVATGPNSAAWITGHSHTTSDPSTYRPVTITASTISLGDSTTGPDTFGSSGAYARGTYDQLLSRLVQPERGSTTVYDHGAATSWDHPDWQAGSIAPTVSPDVVNDAAYVGTSNSIAARAFDVTDGTSTTIADSGLDDFTYVTAGLSGPGGWWWLADPWGANWALNLYDSMGTVIASHTPGEHLGASAAFTETVSNRMAVAVWCDHSTAPYNGRLFAYVVDPAETNPLQYAELSPTYADNAWLAGWCIPQVSLRGERAVAVALYYTNSSPRDFTLQAWAVELDPTPAPEPVVPPPSGIPEVLIDGVPADIESIRVRADSPADFRIPPGGSTLALSQATLGWEHREDAQIDAEQPWHGTWRPTPGAPVEIRLPKPHGADGFVAFTGILDTTVGALGPSVLTSRAISPLADLDATFTAPALNRVMPCPPGGGTPETRRFVHSGTSWYVVEAMEAIGARYTVPRSEFTVWRQTFAGSSWPTVGDLLVSQELNDAGSGPAVPTPEEQNSTYAPEFAPAYGEPGRVAMHNGWCHGATAPYGGNPGDHWLISHDVDEHPTADYRVRLHSTTSQAGLELRVVGSSIAVRTVDGAGAVAATLGTIPRAAATRVMVRYNHGTGTVTAVADNDPDTVHNWPVTIAALNDTRAHVTIYGWRIGAVTIDRAGDVLGDHPYLTWPRQGLIHISPILDERWRFHSHPDIVGEVATTWLAKRAHQEQALLHVDQTNRVHWVEVRGFDDLPITGELTDATLYGSTPTT